MPRRRLRFFVNGLCLLSLLACVGTAWLWRHSYGPGAEPRRFRVRGERYALRSEAGRVTALCLPHGDPIREQGVRQWLARFSNRDLRWVVMLQLDNDDRIFGVAYLEGRRPYDRFPQPLHPPADPACYRPLVDALGDPDRFVLAHAALRWLDGQHARTAIWARRDAAGRWVDVASDNFLIRLPPGGGWSRDPFDDEGTTSYSGPALGYDPAPPPALRDLWFDNLCRPIASVSLGPAAAVFALPPLLRLALGGRRRFLLRRRRHLGLCTRCGYELTGNTSGRCSECGEAVNAEATA